MADRSNSSRRAGGPGGGRGRVGPGRPGSFGDVDRDADTPGQQPAAASGEERPGSFGDVDQDADTPGQQLRRPRRERRPGSFADVDQ